MAGRPTKYKKEYSDQAYKLALLGATDQDLADFFDINQDTIYEWKKNHTEFSESLKRGKMEADAKVAESLYHRALGYSHDSEDIRVIYKDGKANIERIPIIKQYPPDTTAAIFWMKNRQPEQWREKQELEHSGTVHHTHTKIEDIPIEELSPAAQKMLKEINDKQLLDGNGSS